MHNRQGLNKCLCIWSFHVNKKINLIIVTEVLLCMCNTFTLDSSSNITRRIIGSIFIQSAFRQLDVRARAIISLYYNWCTKTFIASCEEGVCTVRVPCIPRYLKSTLLLHKFLMLPKKSDVQIRICSLRIKLTK